MILAGCQSNTSKSSNESNKEEIKLRFSWWGSEDRHKATLEAINLYMEKNPNVTIEGEYGGFDGHYQKLVTQFAGGTAPDLTVLSVDWIEDIAIEGDLVLDLYKQKDIINIDSFDQNFIEKNVVFNDKLVGLPMGINGVVTAYNQEFFKKFNIPEETVWDWETIHQIGKRIHEQDPNSYLLAGLDYRLFLQPYVNQQEGNLWIKEDNTIGFDKETLTEALTYYKQLLDDGVIQPLSESALYEDISENKAWINGQLGMDFKQASMIPRLKSTVPSIGVSRYPIPKDAKATGVIVSPATILAISKQSKHPEEAAKFLNWFLTDKEAAMILKDVRSIPGVKSNAEVLVEEKLVDPTVVEAVNISLESAGDPVYGLTTNQELDQLTTDIMQQVAYGKVTPEQAAEDIINRTSEKLKELVE